MDMQYHLERRSSCRNVIGANLNFISSKQSIVKFHLVLYDSKSFFLRIKFALIDNSLLMISFLVWGWWLHAIVKSYWIFSGDCRKWAKTNQLPSDNYVNPWMQSTSKNSRLGCILEVNINRGRALYAPVNRTVFWK